jgi:hypothetical protein
MLLLFQRMALRANPSFAILLPVVASNLVDVVCEPLLEV